MTELYLKKDASATWHRVYFAESSASGFKLTRENPYFTQSESYTLDVTLPADIPQNRLFFGPLHRIDATKAAAPQMKCMLRVGNAEVLHGTAIVTQVTQGQVKVQLLGGDSELNAKAKALCIDDIDLGTKTLSAVQPDGYDNYNEAGVRFLCLQTYDETNAETVNLKVTTMNGTKEGTTRTPLTSHLEGDAPHPALLDVLARVIERLGYAPADIFPWREPWSQLYVASAKKTMHLAHALPHWTAKEFLDELCRFFNCTLQTDSVAATVSLVSNIDFYGAPQTRQLDVIDEYTAEISQDSGSATAQSLANADIAYDMSSSPAHDYDCLAEAVRTSPIRKTYTAEAALRLAWQAMDAEARRKVIFECPTACYIDWRDTDGAASRLLQVDMLAPLQRTTESDSTQNLKIVPVAITDDAPAKYMETVSGKTTVYDIAFRCPSLENPTGNELTEEEGGAGPDVQDLITGEDSTGEKGEKEDRMQVYIFEGAKQKAVTVGYGDDGSVNASFEAHMPLTDPAYKVVAGSGRHSSWSLSLRPAAATAYLGQLHQNPFSFDMKTRHTFRFIADQMPDPTHIYIIMGKRYGCEKIEASVNAEGFDRLMTGYFYEMLT